MYDKKVWDTDAILENMDRGDLLELIDTNLISGEPLKDTIRDYAIANDCYDIEQDPDFEYEEYRDGLMGIN